MHKRSFAANEEKFKCLHKIAWTFNCPLDGKVCDVAKRTEKTVMVCLA